MKVIGAGLPRTATTTQMFALEQLGFAPCYHMRDLLTDLEGGLPLWEAAVDGNPDWATIFGAAKSTCDWPSAYFYRELMEEYPDAKVLLSVRDAEVWSRSMEQTIWGMWHGDSVLHYLNEARQVVDPLWKRYITMMSKLNFSETGAFAGADDMPKLMAAMERWNQQVQADVPAERLLVWKPEEGVAPLAEFLEVPRPAEDLPRLNDTKAFREGIIGGALDSVTEWWESREKTTEGLHGAAVS
ncbi:MAG TPA: sulfotransferase [Solirubrobacteraceae bacterium]|nr:sulfotransferase [Solirubrobacteraceae bacterium]